MQMRHQPRLIGEERPQRLVDLAWIHRGESEPRQFRHRGEQPARDLPERRPARQVGAIGGQIDPGQHDLARPGRDQRAPLRDDRVERYRAARPPRVGNNAEGAAMIAALLHLQVGTGLSETLTRLRALPSGTLSRGAGEGRGRVSGRWVRSDRVALGAQLRVVVEDEIDFAKRGIALRRQGRGATGDDDARAGMLAAGAADRLARLTLGLGGDRAGVYDNRVFDPRLAGGKTNDVALEGVEPAAERDDLDALHAAQPTNDVGSKRPSYASVAGPVIITCPSCRQRISSSPPSSASLACRRVSPRRLAATRAAQAPVPQARVMPAPRSQTRSRMRSRPFTVATPILARSGNSGSCSSFGPRAARSIASALATKNVACGLPMLPQTGSASAPSARSTRSVSIGRASGISSQAVRAGPISTVTRPSDITSASSSPAIVWMRTCGSPVSSATSLAMHRLALPQASASLPSALRMRMKACAARWLGGSIRISWSQPMPVRRSASARATAASMASSCRRRSSTTKSLPSPCILRNGICGEACDMARPYMAARSRLSNAHRRWYLARCRMSVPRRWPAPCGRRLSPNRDGLVRGRSGRGMRDAMRTP